MKVEKGKYVCNVNKQAETPLDTTNLDFTPKKNEDEVVDNKKSKSKKGEQEPLGLPSTA